MLAGSEEAMIIQPLVLLLVTEGWIIQLLVLLLIAGVCGALGQAIGGYSHGGCLVSIALGFIGALLGSWLAGALHLPELISIPAGGMNFPIIWSIIGAALFVALINLISRRRTW